MRRAGKFPEHVNNHLTSRGHLSDWRSPYRLNCSKKVSNCFISVLTTNSSLITPESDPAAPPVLPAGEFRGEFGEEVAGSTAAGLRERCGIMGEGG